MVSADAEKFCQKSCLSFSDLLAPFVRFKGEEEKEGKEKAGFFFFLLPFFLSPLPCMYTELDAFTLLPRALQ